MSLPLAVKYFKTFVQKGIKSSQTAAYSPWQNQNCENTVKLLKSAIKIYTKATSWTWLDCLPDINIALNKKPRSNCNLGSEQLLFGNSISDHTISYQKTKYKDMDDYFENFLKDITKMQKRFMQSHQQ